MKFGKTLIIIQITLSAILLTTIFFLWSQAHILAITNLGIIPNWYYINIFEAIPVGIILITSIIILVLLNKKKE